MNALANPWIEDDGESRFILDERSFVEALEEPPAFLASPRPEYLEAAELIPVLKVLAGR